MDDPDDSSNAMRLQAEEDGLDDVSDDRMAETMADMDLMLRVMSLGAWPDSQGTHLDAGMCARATNMHPAHRGMRDDDNLEAPRNDFLDARPKLDSSAPTKNCLVCAEERPISQFPASPNFSLLLASPQALHTCDQLSA